MRDETVLYKIVKITDKNGIDKLLDDEAMDRIGRVIDDTQSTISVGSRGILFCVSPLKSILTTRIKKVMKDGDIMRVETHNSKYWMRRIKEP